MEVSWNRATPTSSILMVFCIINHPFGGTPISWAFLWGIYWTVFWSPQTPHVTQDATDLRHVIGAAEALSTITRDTHRQLANMPWHGKKMLGTIQDLLHCLLCWVWYIYIYIMYIHKYIHVYKLFSDTPKMWRGLIWFDLDGSWCCMAMASLQRLDQARHWYLWFLAVKPHVQGEGLPGSCLRMWSIHSMGRWW